MKRWAMTILLVAAVPVSHPAMAAPFTVRLGPERIVLDTPPGFTDTTELASPRLQDLGQSLTSASSRILLFALTDADVRRFMNGDPLETKRYLIAATPRGLERERVSAAQFNELVSDSLRGLGKPADTSDYVKFLDKQSHGKAILLAELKKDPVAFSILQGTRIPGSGGGWNEKPPQYLLSTTTIILVRGKALQLDIFTGFDSPADLDWLTSMTRRWQEELLRLNPR